MVAIFVSHAQEDAECAELIRQDLEAKRYSVWREPTSISIESVLYPRTIENDLLRSAAIVLVWSSSAAQSEWVERHILFAQRMKKLIVPVVIDGTGLPSTLIVDMIVTGQVPCTNVVTQLPPDFPQPSSMDPLIKLAEQAAHEYISIRKEAIDHSAAMLQGGEHREAILALLEYLAQNDLMMGVRDKAQGVLDADAKQALPHPPLLRSDDSRHIIGVRCKQCSHITYFDKRHICSAQAKVIRGSAQRAGKELDEMELPCERCGHKMPIHVDCEGYRYL